MKTIQSISQIRQSQGLSKKNHFALSAMIDLASRHHEKHHKTSNQSSLHIVHHVINQRFIGASGIIQSHPG